jgi:hypothetical protein
VVLYGCETWSLTLREKHRPRVFEKRVLRRIYGPRKDEVTGGWRKLHNGNPHYLYCSPRIIKMIKLRMNMVYSTNGKKDAFMLLVGSQKERDHCKKQEVDDRIILR